MFLNAWWKYIQWDQQNQNKSIKESLGSHKLKSFNSFALLEFSKSFTK